MSISLNGASAMGFYVASVMAFQNMHESLFDSLVSVLASLTKLSRLERLLDTDRRNISKLMGALLFSAYLYTSFHNSKVAKQRFEDNLAALEAHVLRLEKLLATSPDKKIAPRAL